MHQSLYSLAFTFLACGIVGAAEPKVERFTTTYDVSGLIYKGGAKTGLDSVDDVIKAIITSVNPLSWLAAPDGGNRLFEVNGKKLEIYATKNDHDEIAEVLQSIRQMNDLEVDLKTTFLAVDSKWFEKEIQPRYQALTRKRALQFLRHWPKASAEFDWEDEAEVISQLKMNAQVVQTSSVRLANGRDGAIASMRQANTVATGAVDKNGAAVWGVEMTGISYRGKAVVSFDRRFVSLKLEETLLHRPETAEARKSRAIREKKTPMEFYFPDGGVHIVKVPYTPKTIADKGKVLVLEIAPQLFIEAEEKERRGKKDDG
jgi:hypothetical protein